MRAFLLIFILAIAVTAIAAYFMVGDELGLTTANNEVKADKTVATAPEEPDSEAQKKEPEAEPHRKPEEAKPQASKTEVEKDADVSETKTEPQPEPEPKKQPVKHEEPENTAPEKSTEEKQDRENKTRTQKQHYIQLPRQLRGLRFGMSANQVREKRKPAWHKKEKDTLMLVYYFDESKKVEARFHFKKDKGLNKTEIRFKSKDKDKLAELYSKYRQRYEDRYGHLPESSTTWWADSYIHASIDKGRDHVALIFRDR
ncbi:MAG: hypothetical protein ACLFWL_07770 [Candidatus Brocadiia bacterium]